MVQELSRSLYGFVDWNNSIMGAVKSGRVEAYTASWIEICLPVFLVKSSGSKPIRLRGLKYVEVVERRSQKKVEAYTASWIEIERMAAIPKQCSVEAYTASWIEIALVVPIKIHWRGRSLYGFVDWNALPYPFFTSSISSKPIRLRGLKSITVFTALPDGPSKPIRLRGLKSYNCRCHFQTVWVEAYTASWIEILKIAARRRGESRRSLYGFVDWNSSYQLRAVSWVCRSLYGFVDWNFLAAKFTALG